MRLGITASSAPHRQSFLTIEPLRPLPVPHQSFLAQQDVQTALAEAPPLGRQLPHPGPPGCICRSPRPIAGRPAGRLDGAARPPLAHLEPGPKVSDRLAPRGRRQNFFESRSFSATLSSIASAKSFFSFVFSSSSAFSRRASDTSMPPYFAFQA